MVGALADWFAVTALFRHPLGLPIPHTAIIPNRKDQIGRSLGEFVQGNFLTREVLAERLAGVHVGRAARRGGWPCRTTPARASGAPADAREGRRSRCSTTATSQDAIGGLVERRLRQVDVAPLAGPGHRRRPSRAATTSGCSTPSSRASAAFLDENRDTLRGRLQHGVAVVGAGADRRPHLQARSSAACSSFLADVRADPDHEVRQSIEERILDARRPPAHATRR